MYVIGDVHAQFCRLHAVVEAIGGDQSFLQLGDLGVFRDFDIKRSTIDADNFYFFRGNHDSPELIKQHPQNLGDYGYHKSNDLFWMGGGLSIDQDKRIAGRDWWPDEELSFQQLNDVLEHYKKVKPKIVITHECPEQVIPQVADPAMSMIAQKFTPSRTSQALQSMLEHHQPHLWIFGHFHTYKEFNYWGTKFVCLDELINGKLTECIYEIPHLVW